MTNLIGKIFPAVGDEIIVNELGTKIRGHVTGFGKKDGERVVEYQPGAKPSPGTLGSKWCRLESLERVPKVQKATEVSLKTQQEIKSNAAYGGRAEELLSADEIEAMHQQVIVKLATTSGDASECVISARQLALLLAAVVTNSKG